MDPINEDDDWVPADVVVAEKVAERKTTGAELVSMVQSLIHIGGDSAGPTRFGADDYEAAEGEWDEDDDEDWDRDEDGWAEPSRGED